MPEIISAFLLLLVQIALLLVCARILGRVAKFIGFPRVAGELAAGILLGPTFSGLWEPRISDFFNSSSDFINAARSGIIHAGLLFFLAAAGMELQPDQLKKNVKTVAASSFLGMLIPFLTGWMLVVFFPSLFDTTSNHSGITAFFMGTAFSISALPVIAKIMIDLQLMKTRFGTLVMSAAAIDDLAGWVLFSALLSLFHYGTLSPGHLIFQTLLLGSIATAVIYFEKPVERIMGKLRLKVSEKIAAVGIFATAYLSSLACDAVGVHGVFGAFIAGVLFSGIRRVWETLHEKILSTVSKFSAPLFFASVGLKVNFSENFDPVLTAAVFAAACIGKMGGIHLAGRWANLNRKETWGLAFAMNARGAMGIVLASAAFEYGLIQGKLFTALVVMALGTTLISGPALKIIFKK